MRLIWVSAHYPPFHVGGSAVSVQLQAEALVRAGHMVCVVTPRWDASALGAETVNGVLVGRFGVDPVPAGQLSSECVFMDPVFQRIAEGCIAGVVRDIGADLIHAQDRRMIAPAAAAARALGVPAMVTLRDTGLLCPIATCLLQQTTVPADCGQVKLFRECGPWYREHYRIKHSVRHVVGLAYRYRALGHDRETAEGMACVAFVSEGLRKVYASAGWPPAGVRTAILPSPVDPAPPVAAEVAADLRRAHRLEDKPVVLFVGKPSLGKGWPLFVAVAGALRDRANFVHVGSEATMKELIPGPGWRIKSYSFDGIVHVGTQPHETTLAWMRAADVVMVPSVQADALPRVALEAQAQGTLVIGSTRGGVPEANISGRTQLPEPGPMIETVRHALTQPFPFRATVRAEVLAAFSPEATTAKLLACYAEALA